MPIDDSHLPPQLKPKVHLIAEPEPEVVKEHRFKKHTDRLRKFLLWFLATTFVTLLLIPIFTYIYFAKDITTKEGIMNRNNGGVLLLDRKNRPFFSFYQAKNRKFVPLSEIPKYTQQAVIAKEDKDFYKHPGFSLAALARSAISDINQQQFAFGGSTITQQLVKNALLNPNKNFVRKYQELILAFEIERRYSKDEILEMYLNSVYFGEGAFGIEDASQTYFGKDAKSLTLSESAMMAGLLSAPSALSPLSNDVQKAIDNENFVLGKMIEQKYVSQSQASIASAAPIKFNPKKEDINSLAPHFALMVKDFLVNKYGEEYMIRSGSKVRTSLDLDYQQYAETVVKNQVASLAKNKATNGAAMVMDPKTGEIKALVGSKDWYDETNGKINMITTPRQPGSSFKPIIYAKAFNERLITPATILKDEKITFPDGAKGYTPKNYDGKFRGHVTVRDALSNSLNIPAVEVMQLVGVENGLDFAKELGVKDFQGDPGDCGLALVLGCGEVPLLEMVQAYSAFANGGYQSDPVVVTHIQDKFGNTIYDSKASSHQVLDPRVAFLISSILSDNSARAMSFGNALNISRPAAVKTGTTDNYRDALTIGFTPSLVVGVWVGNNNNAAMDNVAGSLGAAPIWRLLMEKFLAGTKVEQFKEPSGISREFICKDKGLKNPEATSSAVNEYFLSGTEPKELCYQPSPTPSATSTPLPQPPTPEPSSVPDQTSNPAPTELPSSSPLPTFSPDILPVVP